MLALPSREDSQEGTKADCAAKTWVTHHKHLKAGMKEGRSMAGTSILLPWFAFI